MRPAFPSASQFLPHRGSGWRLWLAIAVSLLAASLHAQAPTLREYDLKAAFLYNVAKYTDWPREAFAHADDPIVIGILGDDPFGEVLDRLVQNRIVNGHPIVIRRGNGVAELKGAHLVFISPSEAHRAAQHCAALNDAHALSIGDTDQSAPVTAIRLTLENDRVGFVVDMGKIAGARAVISSQLLRFAKTVLRPQAALPST